MEEKIKYKDLSLTLKIGVIGGIVYLSLLTIGFTIGLIFGLLG